MELPDLGKRCAFAICKQLDFLPYTCLHCQHTFCKDHYKYDQHSCKDFKTETPQDLLPIQHFECTFLECVTSNPVQMSCPVCKKHFCLQHRHHGCIDKDQTEREKDLPKWTEPKQQFELAKAEVNRQIDESLNRAQKKSTVNKTAILVQLMRLKGKSIGSKSIPTEDRTYFLIILPLTSTNTNKSKAVFVSKTWTLGRVLDAVADLCDVKNRNNEANTQKLRLFHLSNGQLLASDMSRTLEDLFKEEAVIDGESLVLEYIEESVLNNAILENIQQYRDLL